MLDAAVLAVDDIDDRIAAGDVLVATADGRIVGVVVLDSRPDVTHIVGIAVQRRRRAKGIGTALVEAASRRGPLTAEFDERVRPFYESLGFEIEPADDPGRCRGVLDRA
nr:GNAT family N-acetyltransferase [Natranaeroarchaeum aerophilus]